MTIIHRIHTNGYTLIELLVYIAIFVALSLLLVQSLVTSVRVYAASQGTRALSANGDLALDRLTREVRDATTITGTFNANPSTLILTGTDSSGAVQTVTFSVVNHVLQISDNGAMTPLSSTNVSVTNFTANHITNAGSDAVRITLILSTASGAAQSATFNTTALARGESL